MSHCLTYVLQLFQAYVRCSRHTALAAKRPIVQVADARGIELAQTTIRRGSGGVRFRGSASAATLAPLRDLRSASALDAHRVDYLTDLYGVIPDRKPIIQEPFRKRSGTEEVLARGPSGPSAGPSSNLEILEVGAPRLRSRKTSSPKRLSKNPRHSAT